MSTLKLIAIISGYLLAIILSIWFTYVPIYRAENTVKTYVARTEEIALGILDRARQINDYINIYVPLIETFVTQLCNRFPQFCQ